MYTDRNKQIINFSGISVTRAEDTEITVLQRDITVFLECCRSSKRRIKIDHILQ